MFFELYDLPHYLYGVGWLLVIFHMMVWAGCLDVELAGVVQESFGLGVDEAEDEEDEVVHACYVGEEAAEEEEDDHLPEC